MPIVRGPVEYHVRQLIHRRFRRRYRADEVELVLYQLAAQHVLQSNMIAVRDEWS